MSEEFPLPTSVDALTAGLAALASLPAQPGPAVREDDLAPAADSVPAPHDPYESENRPPVTPRDDRPSARYSAFYGIPYMPVPYPVLDRHRMRVKS